ncbi:glycosyltransferase family 39 protein [bacterium]|nr:glycosyltransferase family 39 protein [bacterium]
MIAGVAGIAAASLALRCSFALCVGLFQDEAFYWWFAQDGGVTFCPSPPLVSLLVGWSEALMGSGTLSVRAGSLLWGTVSIGASALLAFDLYGNRAALWAAALTAACPLMAVTASIATPEAPMTCLWLLFTWAAWRAVHRESAGWWCVAGVLLALGAYAKYIMALAVPCFFVALSSTSQGRSVMKRPGPWLALAIAAFLFVPAFIAWNARNEWAALRFHLASRHQWECDPSLLVRYVGIHLAAISPVLCIAVLATLGVLWRSWRRRGCGASSWLLAFAGGPILFFALPSVCTEQDLVRVHWDLAGYAVGIVAVAGVISGADGPRHVWRLLVGIAATACAALVTVAVFLASLFPGAGAAVGVRPPTRQMLGWGALATKVTELDRALGPEPRFILTRSFDTAVCLAFARRSRERIYTIRDAHAREYGLYEQLSRWRIDEEHFLSERLGHEAIYVHEFRHPEAPRPQDHPRRVYRYFEKLDPLDEVVVSIGGRTVRRFGLYRASQMLLPP